MKNLFLFMLYFSFTAQAQVQIQVVDPEVNTKELEDKGYQVSREEKEFTSLPDRDKRDELLKGLHIANEWDELQKDIFYMDLKSKTLEQLANKYPEISRARLQQLKVKRG